MFNLAQWFEMFWVHELINRWKWKLLCTLTMSLTLSTTSAHLAASECSFKAFSSSSNRHSKMEEIWDTWRHKHEIKQRKIHIFFIPVCWSLAPLWRTRLQAWGWTVCRCCSSSVLTGWPCSPALDALHDGSSARWWPRASPHVHIARAAWPSGTCAPLWKWGGLEDLSVERTERKSIAKYCEEDERVSHSLCVCWGTWSRKSMRQRWAFILSSNWCSRISDVSVNPAPSTRQNTQTYISTGVHNEQLLPLDLPS